MAGTPWDESEVRAAIAAYFRILNIQERGGTINKSALYRDLARAFPKKNAKAFELKLQNISAILYEERYPFADGLMPRGNYQNLLKLMVWDHLKRSGPPKQMPWEILIDRLRRLYSRGAVKVRGSGAGRFGLTLERELGIPPNSSKAADFMGIELKTKVGSTLQTLFSRVPSRFVEAATRHELLHRFGKRERSRGRMSLYTSFGRSPDSFGFRLYDSGRAIQVRNGTAVVLEYAYEHLEESLLSKHAESVYVVAAPQEDRCRFPLALYCRGPSVLRFLKLVRDGRINLDFTLSSERGVLRDHGFLWRIHLDSLKDLYISESRTFDFAAEIAAVAARSG